MDEIEKAIKSLKDENNYIHIDYSNRKDLTGVLLLGKQAELAIIALQEKQERENPQPLTYKQLKERVGKPVYTVYNNGLDWRVWGIVALADDTVVIRYIGGDILPRENENRMKFYDHEPKEE